MLHSLNAIKKVAKLTDRVILFHSGNGKDSIALLELISPHFKEVVCVYMYVVKDLEHINNYIGYAKKKYPNCRFIEVPHYCLSQYYKYGILGCKRIKNQTILSLADITKSVKINTGIEWAFFGFKKSDSLNRRLMLGTYEDEAISYPKKNCYPLSRYKNSDVLNFISAKKLLKPTVYGNGQSQGANVGNLPFLYYCKENYPNDYKKIIEQFPQSEIIMFEYENSNNE